MVSPGCTSTPSDERSARASGLTQSYPLRVDYTALPSPEEQFCAMHTTNVRELKKNPSRALRLAKEDPVLILKGNEPDAVLMHLDKSLTETEAGMRPALAASLYKGGSVSLGRAAKISAASPRASLSVIWVAWASRLFGTMRPQTTKRAMSPRGSRHKRCRTSDRTRQGRLAVHSSQSSNAKPSTPSNSRTLRVIKVRERATACPAINTS